jgi:3-dehydro-4-phosphotetronate decarboxylase
MPEDNPAQPLAAGTPLTALARQLAAVGKSLFDRGYAYGTAGNLSARNGQQTLATPTNSSLGDLDPSQLSVLSLEGAHLAGPKATKEINFHLGIYRTVPEAAAIVHLHSTYATAFSCLQSLAETNPLPSYTPYFPMRVAAMPVVAYHHPGSRELAVAIEAVAARGPVILLRNHGSIAWAKDLATASALAEELEEQCRIHFLLAGQGRTLSAEQVSELRARFPPGN